MTLNFHVEDSQKNAWYSMIMGRNFLSGLQRYLCLSDYTIRVNVGAYKGCTESTIDTKNSYVTITSDLLDDARFRGEQ